MRELPANGRNLHRIYLVKWVRVFVSGLLSITLPFYLKVLGYSPFYQGIVLVAIVAGNAFSNFAVGYLDASFGRRRLLQIFSILMVVSGATLVLSTGAALIIAACFIGNISSTGTEAGPFQSIETGVLPDLAPPGIMVKVFGRYNLIGYSAAAVGQLASAGPGLAGNELLAFQVVFASFSLAGMMLLYVYSGLGGLETGLAKGGLTSLSPSAKKDLLRLSGLFSIDAFGAVFVTTYVLSIWFNTTYGLQLETLGPVFFVATVASAASTYGAALIAVRIGNLRTMVYTHLASGAFLILMGLAGSLGLALVFLFLRQGFSQMDVPTRQALMAEIFQREERVQAYAVTNTFRSGGSLLGGPAAAGILGLGLVSVVPFTGGGIKILYDLMTFGAYRKRYR